MTMAASAQLLRGFVAWEKSVSTKFVRQGRRDQPNGKSYPERHDNQTGQLIEDSDEIGNQVARAQRISCHPCNQRREQGRSPVTCCNPQCDNKQLKSARL